MRLVKVLPVDVRGEDERIRGLLANRELEFVRQGNMNRLAAVCAGGLHLRFEAFVPYAPFNEGRRNRVNRSSREAGFPGFEGDPVRRFGRSHRKCPEHGSGVISNQEEQIPLEIPEDHVQFVRLHRELL